MLTDLSFLQTGKPWPPVSERVRINRYKQNSSLFEGNHSKIYREQFKRIERVIGNFEEIISYPVVINFQKLLSLKMADLLLGEIPKINSSIKQEKIQEIINYSSLINKAYEVALDVSRYGTGIFLLYGDEKGKGVIDITQPTCWFPVVSSDNIKKTLYHVLAWTYKRDYNYEERTYLKVQIHEKGYYTAKEFVLEGGSIGKMIISEEKIPTGFDDFAVIPVHNTITSDRIYGIDDYMDIDSIISEIEVRVAQVSAILDKHSSPTMTGPSTALTEDGQGGYVLKTGNYIINDSNFDGNTSEVKYITWDAHLNANFVQIEKLVNFLYMVSETGVTLLDSQVEAGRAESGTALKLRMMSPLAKVNRIRMKFDPVLKNVISTVSQLGWDEHSIEDVNIIWKDGLPDDPKEEAEIMRIRTGGKATISQKEAIKRQDDLDDLQAKLVLEDISGDEERLSV